MANIRITVRKVKRNADFPQEFTATVGATDGHFLCEFDYPLGKKWDADRLTLCLVEYYKTLRERHYNEAQLKSLEGQTFEVKD